MCFRLIGLSKSINQSIFIRQCNYKKPTTTKVWQAARKGNSPTKLATLTINKMLSYRRETALQSAL